MIALYIISVLVCVVVFAAIAESTKGLPEHNTGSKAFVVIFFTLCPIINTLVALLSVISLIAILIGKFK